MTHSEPSAAVIERGVDVRAIDDERGYRSAVHPVLRLYVLFRQDIPRFGGIDPFGEIDPIVERGVYDANDRLIGRLWYGCRALAIDLEHLWLDFAPVLDGHGNEVGILVNKPSVFILV